MKKLLILICVCALCCVPVFAKGDTEDASLKNGNAFIECNETDKGVNVRVTNNSKETLKNVQVTVKSSKGYVPTESVSFLNNIKSEGSDIAIVHLVKNNPLLEMVGYFGYRVLCLLVVVFVVVIIACALVGIRGARSYIGIIGFCLGIWLFVFAMFTGLGNNSSRVALGGSGENFSRSACLDTKSFGKLNIELTYNQDVVETKIYEKDVSVNSPKKYVYDENVPVTDKEKVVKKGKKGKKHVVTTVTYRNGKKYKTDVQETVLKEPVATTISKGTKVVKKIETIEPTKLYIANDKMYVGDFKMRTSKKSSEKHYGKCEIVYSWNEKEKKVDSTKNILKKQGTDEYDAGCLVKRSDVEKANTTYKALEDKEVGYTNVVKKTVDGENTTIYKVSINSTNGKPEEGCTYEYVKSSSTKPVNGVVEVGVRKVEKVTTPCDENITYDSSKWDNYSEVVEQGQDKVEEVTSVMVLDTKTGKVTDTVKQEISRNVVQESKPSTVVKGNKKPEFVEEKILTDHVKYNTVYKENDELKGDEQKVVQKGEMGRLYTTQLVAVDENGNKIEGYEPKVVEKDALVDPVDEVIEVAKGSKLLKEK